MNRHGRLRTMLVVLGLLLALVAALRLLPSEDAIGAPAPLSVAEAAGRTDAELVGRTSIDLTFRLVSPRTDPLAWRRLSGPARQVFMLAYADEQLRRERLIDLYARIRQLGNGITLAQIAEAYGAIGLPAVAAVLQQAATIAESNETELAALLERRQPGGRIDPAGDPFASLQGDLRRALGATGITKPCAAYIRAHAAEILAP